MKKALISFIVLVIVISLIGCKPSGMSKEAYDLGKEALNVADQYISAKITSSQCVAKLDNIYERLELLGEMEEDSEASTYTLLVRMPISDMSFQAKLGETADFKAARSELAKTLGK